MMEVTVYGFEALTKALTENNGQRKFVLFTGSKDKDGVSWCPDCNDAFPHIKKAFSNASDVLLIVCEVGPRDEWKNPNNDFRKKLGIKCVPTLINWEKKEIKLEEEQCLDDELLEMALED